MQPSVPGSPYGDNYQQPFGTSYGRGYGAPAPYQPALQPHMFLPSQTPQVPQVLYVTSFISYLNETNFLSL